MRVKLTSKRHDVYLDKQVISKYYKDHHSYETEKYFLTLFDHKRLLVCDDNNLMIQMTYIEGQMLLDLIESLESSYLIEEAVQLLNDVLDELDKFHQCVSYKYRYYDLNYRNMIVSKSISLIDFETVQLGDYKLDYFDFVGMFMTYNPLDTSFKREVEHKLAPLIMKRLGISRHEYDDHMNQAIEKIVRRREA